MRRAMLLAAVLAWAAAPAHATVPAGNLLANPGAEAAAGGADENTIDPPPSWTTTGALTATQYGPDGPQAFPTTSQSATYGGGANFFSGGNQPSSTGTQSVDLSAAASEIDAGSVSAAFSGLVGGYQNQADTMTVVASWLDGSGNALGTLQLGPVTADQRSNTTELLAQSASGAVPAGTRSVRVVMTATRASGTSNDGYADNLSLTLSGPGSGGGAGGTHGSATDLACNRGADPGSPWTCYATVADKDASAPSAPSGSVAFASSRGGSFDVPSCALTASTTRPNTATCSATWTPGATGSNLTAAYGGDSVHGTSTDSFTIKGAGDIVFCGAAPLPACPAGQPPPQVCVSIWVGDCDGKLPPPDPLSVCVSAFENCTGFGGSKPAKPGTIDLSGLPASQTTGLDCATKKKTAARQFTGASAPPGFCPISVGIVEYSPITDKHDYEEAAKAWKDVVETSRHNSSMAAAFYGGAIGSTIDAIFRLAHFESAAFGQKLRTQIDAATDSAYDCLKPAGSKGEACDVSLALLPICSNPFGNPLLPATVSGSKADEQTCNDVTGTWHSALRGAIASLAAWKTRFGVDRPFKASLRARGSGGPRRTVIGLMTGGASVKRGKHGKLKLTLAKGAKKRLRAERKAGAGQVSAHVVVARGRILGLAPLTKTRAIHLVLAHRQRAHR